MRLIDADDLKENHMYFDECYGISYAQEFDIDGCPTVDAVQVVRCKDCKWSYDAIGGTFCSHGVCVDCVVYDDWFCADGKRRSE